MQTNLPSHCRQNCSPLRLEVDPTVESYCERPVCLKVTDGELPVDFWVRQNGREVFLVIEDGDEASAPQVGDVGLEVRIITPTELEVTCRTCGAKAPYQLNVSLLDVPYRCGSCGHLYGASPPSALPNKRAFNQKVRIAIT